MDFMDPRFPWPSQGDELLTNNDDHWTTASVFPNRRTFIQYAYSYRRAAELLFDETQHPGGDPDSLVYPMIFLWRQYLELIMKALILAVSQLLGVTTRVPLHHKIDVLWFTLRPLLESIGGVSIEELLGVEGTIKRFAQLDPDSMAFRYPRDKHGRLSFPTDVERINLTDLHEVLCGVGNFMDAGYDMIDDHQRNMPSADEY